MQRPWDSTAPGMREEQSEERRAGPCGPQGGLWHLPRGSGAPGCLSRWERQGRLCGDPTQGQGKPRPGCKLCPHPSQILPEARPSQRRQGRRFLDVCWVLCCFFFFFFIVVKYKIYHLTVRWRSVPSPRRAATTSDSRTFSSPRRQSCPRYIT